jgi:hypothetical protein
MCVAPGDASSWQHVPLRSGRRAARRVLRSADPSHLVRTPPDVSRVVRRAFTLRCAGPAWDPGGVDPAFARSRSRPSSGGPARSIPSNRNPSMASIRWALPAQSGPRGPAGHRRRSRRHPPQRIGRCAVGLVPFGTTRRKRQVGSVQWPARRLAGSLPGGLLGRGPAAWLASGARSAGSSPRHGGRCEYHAGRSCRVVTGGLPQHHPRASGPSSPEACPAPPQRLCPGWLVSGVIPLCLALAWASRTESSEVSPRWVWPRWAVRWRGLGHELVEARSSWSAVTSATGQSTGRSSHPGKSQTATDIGQGRIKRAPTAQLCWPPPGTFLATMGSSNRRRYRRERRRPAG